MDLKRSIKLPNEVAARCRKHGADIIAAYKRGDNPASHAFSSHGADADPILQAEAKMGECAAALWCGLDPMVVLNWKAAPDDYDLTFLGQRIDVKTIKPFKSFLSWPVRKNDIYPSKRFDVLWHVKGKDDGEEPIFDVCGWITKSDFFEKRLVAGVDHKLTKGTWHVHERVLPKMDAFVLRYRPGHVYTDHYGRLLHYCHCGDWATHGFGVNVGKGQLGKWYCGKHLPKPQLINSSQPQPVAPPKPRTSTGSDLLF